MKLLLCTSCQDVFKLQLELRTCRCGAASGRYLDGLHAEYSGDSAIPIGFDNPSLTHAIRNRPAAGIGVEFVAFVIPRICKTYSKRVKKEAQP